VSWMGCSNGGPTRRGLSGRGDSPGGRGPGLACGLLRARWRVAVAAMVVAGWPGCAPAPAPGAVGGPVAEPRRVEEVDPARAGTLTQAQISVRLAARALRIEVTPLADWVLEAAAPDTRDRLVRIAEAHGIELARRTGVPEPVLFLVSLSTRSQGTPFQPDDLHMLSRGLRQRPLAIRPITPGWGRGRLSVQTSEIAVYAYDSGLDLKRELTVAYQGVEDSSWARRVVAIEAERGRIGR